MACVRSSTRTVGVLSTQSRKVRHTPPRHFLALQQSQYHRFLPTTQVIDRLFIMVIHMTTDVLESITYKMVLPQASDPLRPMLLRVLGCRRRRPTSLPVVHC